MIIRAHRVEKVDRKGKGDDQEHQESEGKANLLRGVLAEQRDHDENNLERKRRRERA